MAKFERTALTVDNIRRVHKERRREIRARLAEFADIGLNGTDEDLFAEMVMQVKADVVRARARLAAARRMVGVRTSERER